MSKLEWGLVTIVVLGVLISLFGPQEKRRGSKVRLERLNSLKEKNGKTVARRTSKVCRSDEVILSSPLIDLSGVEF